MCSEDGEGLGRNEARRVSVRNKRGLCGCKQACAECEMCAREDSETRGKGRRGLQPEACAESTSQSGKVMSLRTLFESNRPQYWVAVMQSLNVSADEEEAEEGGKDGPARRRRSALSTVAARKVSIESVE